MTCYCLAGNDFYFPFLIPELESYRILDDEPSTAYPLTVPSSLTLSCQTIGWVGDAQRKVKIWTAPPGVLLKVEGGSDFYIDSGGSSIIRVDRMGHAADSTPVGLDRDILLGPALVLALAMRGTWSLHASAVAFRDNLIVFLGESRQGKSTLAAYLANEKDWCLVADDILPVTLSSIGAVVWPHFPQLKLPVDKQPGSSLTEHIPINRICVLTQSDIDKMPEFHFLSPSQSVQVLLGHTAGSRLFDPALLAAHLVFCSELAERLPVCNLLYPHRKDTLPQIRRFLENLD